MGLTWNAAGFTPGSSLSSCSSTFWFRPEASIGGQQRARCDRPVMQQRPAALLPMFSITLAYDMRVKCCCEWSGLASCVVPCFGCSDYLAEVDDHVEIMLSDVAACCMC